MGHWPERRLSALTRMDDLEGKREFAFPDIRGWKVVNTTGHKVGKVEEVFVDPNTLAESMRGTHIHSTFPLGATSAVVSQSDRKA